MPNRDLPVYELESAIVASLRASGRVIVQAPTGSGKSTQLPQMLLSHGFLGDRGQVVVLQPRRLAARMLARRVAEEVGTRARRPGRLPDPARVARQRAHQDPLRDRGDPPAADVVRSPSSRGERRSSSTSSTSGTSTGTSRSRGRSEIQAHDRPGPEDRGHVGDPGRGRACGSTSPPARSSCRRGGAFPVRIEYLAKAVNFDDGAGVGRRGPRMRADRRRDRRRHAGLHARGLRDQPHGAGDPGASRGLRDFASCRSTASFRRRRRTGRWRAPTGARSSSRRTWPRPRSRSTG
jgi:hypothetical protein